MIGRLLQSHILIMKRLNSILKATKKIVLKGIERAKKEYFDRVFVAYKCDMKRTWQVIRETLNRNKKKQEMPSLFTHEGCDLSGSTKIANTFNTYFANICKNYPHKLIKIVMMLITNNI